MPGTTRAIHLVGRLMRSVGGKEASTKGHDLTPDQRRSGVESRLGLVRPGRKFASLRSNDARRPSLPHMGGRAANGPCCVKDREGRITRRDSHGRDDPARKG
jgi:hypothetical protein